MMKSGMAFFAAVVAFVVAAATASAQSTTTSTCAIANTLTVATLSPMTVNISLVSLASGTLTYDPIAFSLGFCSPIQPSSAGLTSSGASACDADGFVAVTNLTSGQCLASYPFITTTIAYTSGGNAVSSVVGTNNGLGAFANTRVNVTLSCSNAVLRTRAVLAENVTYDATSATWLLHLRSGAACNSSSFFCASNADCTDGRSCVNGVCFNTACAQVHAVIAPFAKVTSSVLTQVAVTDCSGTPLPNLTASDFDVTLNGVSLRRTSQFRGEVAMYVSSSSSAQPSLTVLLIDMSSSITSVNVSLTAVKAAATRFVQLVQSRNQFHYIAVVAFDGSGAPVIVVGHTTDTAKLLAGIASMPPPSLKDPSSTNLYGAVTEAVALANAMRFSFGKANSTVSSTLIVFTDGFDTSARQTRIAAVSAVQKQVATVRVVGVGVASTSDAVFLQSISTSGIFYFSSDVSTIASAFELIAQRLATSESSTYSVGICSPLRSSNVTAVFMLNTSAFTTRSTVSANFDASKHEGGSCNTATLAAELLQIAQNSSTSNKTETLVVGGSLSVSVEPQAALFFSVTCTPATSPVLVSVSPTTVSAYMLNSTASCGRVSPYCWDATFTSFGVLSCATDAITFTGMLVPPTAATSPTTVVVSAISLASATPAPAVVTASTSTTAAAPAPSSTLFDVFNASSYTTEGSSHVDTPAAWIIFVFLLLGVFIAIGYNLYQWSQRAKEEEEMEARRGRSMRMVNPANAWGDRHDSSPRQQLVILAAPLQPYNVHSPMRGPGNNSNGSVSPVAYGAGAFGHAPVGAGYPQGGLSRSSAALTPVGHSRASKGFVPLDARAWE